MSPSYHEFLSNGIPATVQSWSYPYKGDVANVLYDYVKSRSNSNIYARIMPIVQSSGMGKSRMVDEFSKDHFVIPFNLRDGDQGDFRPHIAILALMLDGQVILLLMLTCAIGFYGLATAPARPTFVSAHSSLHCSRGCWESSANHPSSKSEYWTARTSQRR
jgi:hypothetical protein